MELYHSESIWSSDPFAKEPMRADARKNYSQLLTVAREVVTEHGVNAAMRDIARRSGVGLATLLRHFPTREALYEAAHDSSAIPENALYAS